MDDALFVRARQAFGHLRRDVERARRVEPRARDQRRSTSSPRISSIAMKLTPSASPTSWMTPMCGCSRREAACASRRNRRFWLGIRNQLGRQHLERDLPAQRRIEGAVDDAHPAASHFLEDSIVADRAADERRHVRAYCRSGRCPPPAFWRPTLCLSASHPWSGGSRMRAGSVP